jgi:hypothetical protein
MYVQGDVQLSGSILKELLSGEDQTNNLIVVENRYNYKNLNALATTTVKGTPGFLHAVIINKAGATGNTATLYDGPTAAGNIIATIDLTALSNRIYNVQFTSGLTVVLANGTSADITIAYR